VLALLVIKEKGWLVSSSSAGDVRVSYLLLERAWADDRSGAREIYNPFTSFILVITLLAISTLWLGITDTEVPSTLVSWHAPQRQAIADKQVPRALL
jgi:hypothetical protein